jgi:hypothetical protein
VPLLPLAGEDSMGVDDEGKMPIVVHTSDGA